MKRVAAILMAAIALPAAAAPVRITCNGAGLHPATGRVAMAGTLTFAFEFDQAAQSMTLTAGAPQPVPLDRVSITDSMVRGTDGKHLFEVNRIEGTATIRVDPATNPDAVRLGMLGPSFRGTCATAGTARF